MVGALKTPMAAVKATKREEKDAILKGDALLWDLIEVILKFSITSAYLYNPPTGKIKYVMISSDLMRGVAHRRHTGQSCKHP